MAVGSLTRQEPSMRPTPVRAAILMLFLVPAAPARAQQPASAAPAVAATVPRVMRVAGTFRPTNHLPLAEAEVVTVSIYAAEVGESPLWQETQQVRMDAEGRYSLLLGSTSAEGLPRELFASGEARWLGLHFDRPGEADPPRTRLTSVPYALRSEDADTLGGLPPSAYQRADSGPHQGPGASRASDPQTAQAALGTTNFLSKFTSTVDLGNSVMYDSGGRIGLGTTGPLDLLHSRFTDTSGALTGYAVQNLGSGALSYSGMLFYDQNGAVAQFQGFNNSTHEYRINNVASSGTINFMIGGTSRFQVRNDGDIETGGSLRKGGLLFMHSRGSSNAAVGLEALSSITSGFGNTAIGHQALRVNTVTPVNVAVGISALSAFNSVAGSDGFNVAVGAYAMTALTGGYSNVAVGHFALGSQTTGIFNTAQGHAALGSASGDSNTAVGAFALHDVVGSANIGLGAGAGSALTTGANNIDIAASGVAGESGKIRIGIFGTHDAVFFAGIRGITTGASDAVPVVIDSNGQLGTVNSSRRYKTDIQDMGDASSGLMKLRPVTYRYQQPYADGSQPIDYGLIAEEVQEVYPDVVAHLADGGVETVQYQKINAMLLNEVQKQHREIETLKARLAALERLILNQKH
jgi:hypothetical protein